MLAGPCISDQAKKKNCQSSDLALGDDLTKAVNIQQTMRPFGMDTASIKLGLGTKIVELSQKRNAFRTSQTVWAEVEKMLPLST